MRVLIACERSGVVREAFKELGHEAWSCDLEPSRQPGNHIQDNVLTVLNKDWDLMIAHPECRYLAVSGMHWTTRGLRDPKLTQDAIAFAEALWFCSIPKICLENPVSVLSTKSKLGKPTMIIQPWWFGHPESKKTCLWLKGVPRLKATDQLDLPVSGRWKNQTPSGQNKLGPSELRSELRAKTYLGIAKAMAQQWGAL